MTFSQHTLGKYFRKEGKIYRHVVYCAEPTATLQLVGHADHQVGGAVGSRILSEFEPLTEAECALLDEAFTGASIPGEKE
jgi:hypothetical protein